MKTPLNTIIVLLTGITVLLAQSEFDDDELLRAKSRSMERLAKKLMLANTQATLNQELFDVKYYGLDLNLDVSEKIIDGAVVVRGLARSNLSKVELNFLDNMTVDSVTVDEEKLTFQHDNNILSVNLLQTTAQGELFTFQVFYHGHPASGGFGPFGFDSYNGKPMIWSLSEPFGARHWWPCKDIPSDKADSVDIRVTVPSHLIVASNGVLVERHEQGDKAMYHWHEGYPITTYLVSVAIHPYHTYSDWYISALGDSMEVQFYVFKDHLPMLREDYAKTVEMIRIFSQLFGEYPFIDEKYGHAEFTWGGGMEHQTLTSLGGWSEILIAHELAHQWWGDMVTCADFHHIWLNEGFATYSEALWIEEKYGEQRFHQHMRHKMYHGSGTIYVENPQSENIFDYGLSYAKGAWVVHMLRHVVGDKTFYKILQQYREQYLYDAATTEDFRNVCENVSGLDFEQFFQQWIYQSGFPDYEYFWSANKTNEGEHNVTVTVRQTQDYLFHMPLDITFVGNGKDTTLVFENNQRTRQFSVVLPFSPVMVILDKDNWVLKRVDEIKTPVFELQSFEIKDMQGQVVQRLNPGESVYLDLSFLNAGIKAEDVIIELAADYADIAIEPARHTIDLVDKNSAFSVDGLFTIHASAHAEPRLLRVNINVYTADGLVDQEFTIQLPLGQSTVLFVDDDQGKTYESYYQNMARKTGVLAEMWNVNENGVPDVKELSPYKSVVWFTGDDRETTLTSEEQTVIRDYLGQGGRLLVTGQDIGYDLVEAGTNSDSVFFATVLHARFLSDASGQMSVVGIPGDPVGNALAVRFEDMYGGANNQNSPSIIEAIAPAHISFQYLPGKQGAGLRYENPVEKSKLVYLAFGMEGIAGPKDDSAAMVLQSILNWLEKPVETSVTRNYKVPTAFSISQNYPNPFNPQTAIDVRVPSRAQVEIVITNTIGQRIRGWTVGEMMPGTHTLHWDGLNAAGTPVVSGLYILSIRMKLENKVMKSSIKMIKLE